MNLKDEQEKLRLRNVTVPQTLKQAKALRRKKHRDHKRYLVLKKRKKVLTNAVQDELRSLLVSFRELGTEMKIAKDSLKNVRETSAQKSTYFQDGYRLGIEYAQVQAKQQALDQQ